MKIAFLSFWAEKRGGPHAGRMLNGWMTGCSSYTKYSTEGSRVG